MYNLSFFTLTVINVYSTSKYNFCVSVGIFHNDLDSHHFGTLGSTFVFLVNTKIYDHSELIYKFNFTENFILLVCTSYIPII